MSENLSPPAVAIGAALDWELRAVLRAAGETRRVRHGELRAWQARCGAQPLLFYRTGVGVAAASRRTATLLAAGGVGCLINTGCAGALRDDLPAGTLLVAEAMIGPLPDLDRQLPAAALTARLHRVASSTGLQVAQGSLLTSAVPLLSAASKRQHGTAHAAAAVDMESAAVCAAARAHGVPMATLRAILDSVETDLPGALLAPRGIRDAIGRFANDPGGTLATTLLRRHQNTVTKALEQVFTLLFADLRDFPFGFDDV